ncbi:hypothetical protein PS421_01385 [Pediococcus pentosaceus]|uniref:metallophosphoesterase n=1 Tax=Pediococcus pentosaceus TaxID=1255 RepID=UPI002F2649E3
MAITTIVMDVYKPGSELKNKVVDISDSFNARVGDNQVRLVIKYIERGIVERMEQEQLTPFMMGWVGQQDEEQKVTAETGIAVSYHGSTNDIIGGGKVRMDLPGTMFPQEGAFYGFFGLENSSGKRVTTNNVLFKIENNNPDMYVDTLPFRTELQKLLDWATAQAKSNLSGIDTDWEALKATIKAMIEKDDTDLISISNRIGLAEADLKELLKQIADNNVVTIDYLNKLINNFVVDVPENMDIGGELTPEMKNIADNFISALPKDGFKFLMVTDSHYEDTAFPLPGLGYPHGKESLWHLSIVDYLANYVDVVVAGGDNTNGMTFDYTHTVADQDLFATKLLDTPGKADKFLLKGNHDDGSPIMRYGTTMPDGTLKMGSAQPSDVMTDDDFKEVFRTSQQLYNEQRQDGDSLYFYKDYPDSKIRLIGLDSFDVPTDTVNDDGTLTHMRYITTSFSNKQLNWLISEALMNVPEDYQVIITTHCPQVGGDLAEDPESTWYNHELLQGILDSFVKGTSYTGQSPAETPKEMFAKVSTNFTGQGPRVIAGYYVGHYHEERIEKLDNFTEVLFLNDANGDQTQSAESFNVNSLGIAVATVDTANRSVQINGLGRATNRSYKY